MVCRCVMGRQREQMTLNNPDILFIHLSAPWKDETSVNEIFHVEARMHFGYLHANVQHSALYHCIFQRFFNMYDNISMKRSLSR